MPPPLRIQRVATRRDLHQFVCFPWTVYRHDPNWVPPLITERLEVLDPARNPFFSHARVELYLALVGGQPAGRIAAFVDDHANAFLGEQMGGFGFFEVVEAYEIGEKLLDTACQAARGWGMQGIRGPVNFDINDQPGVLVEGADCPPALLEAHTPPYYQEFLERYGMQKFRDNMAWRVSLSELGATLNAFPEQVLRVFTAASQRGDVTIRKVHLDDWDQEVATAHHLFDETLRHLPEHIPLPLAEFHRIVDQLKPLVDPDLALFAEADGKVVGFLVAIPDFNQVLLHLDGRLFPLGWLKFWWYRRRINVVSFKLFGVLEEYRRRGIDVLMYLQAVRTAVTKGYHWLDGSLTSENNPTVVHLAERMGAERYKLYRIYQLMF